MAGNVPAEMADALREYFGHVVLLPADGSIAPPVSHHPDMIFAVVGDALVTHEGYYYDSGGDAIDEICSLGGFRLVLSKGERGEDYPRDVGFNALVVGNSLVGNLKSLAAEVLALATENGLKTEHVRQGYAACTTLSVPSRNLVCTADGGIGTVCERLGADVVRIPSDTGITLPGYDCGFIGGCTGVWENTVFFCGDPMVHPTLAPLCDALTARGIETVSLSDGVLTDYGGIKIFPLCGQE